MFFKKNYENLIYFFSFISIIFFYLYYKNSLFSHWSDILDQDVTLVYNSLLIGSNIPQQYLDHPAFTTFFILNIIYKIGYVLNLIEIKNLNELFVHSNKDSALQIIHNVSQFVHLTYSLILILIFKKVINDIIRDNLSSFFLSLIFLISPSFIFLFDIIRSEILSLIFLFLFYICLENSLKKNIFFIILAGGFFVLALLAKVQVIICLFSILLIFIIKNYQTMDKKKIHISNLTKTTSNILFVVFLIAIVDNFFYKRVDKIFFILILFSFILAFSILEKKKISQINSNVFLILFFTGCSLTLLSFKFFSILGFAKFNPALIDIITSPISQMSNISTGYEIGRSDNFEYVYKIKSFFFDVVSKNTNNELRFLFNKFNIFSYILSFSFIIYFCKKKEYFKTILILLLTLSILFIIIIFNFRPYHFYDIYILPLNLILISILIKNIRYKNILSFVILLIYATINLPTINEQLTQKRLSGFFDYQVNLNNNMKHICKEEQIIDKNSYMRYWHKEYNSNFLRELCESYFRK